MGRIRKLISGIGIIPSPLGEIVEYFPSRTEILVTMGIWALGLLIMTLLIRVAISIELGTLSRHKRTQST